MILSITDEAQLFLETECTRDEREAFKAALAAVTRNPVENSRPWLGRSNARHGLRFFRFGGCRAFFVYYWSGDAEHDIVQVRTCRRSRPTREK